MKTITLAMALLLMAAAPEGEPIIGNPAVELATLTDCVAVEMSLMQVHQQAAATMRATMPDTLPPPLAKLFESYTVLGNDAHEQVDSYMATINDAVIPHIVRSGGDAAALTQKVMTVLSHKVIHNAVVIGDPTRNVDDQTTLLRGIIEQTKQCAGLAAAVRDEYKGIEN